MNYYAGLDVSLEETAICVVDGSGLIVKEVRAASEPEALIAALKAIDVTDFVLDGEAVAHCSQGLPDFLARDGQRTACLCAFDLLHLRATDLRPVELVGRRAMLKKLIRRAGPVLIFSDLLVKANQAAQKARRGV